jgi:predicted Zn-dependent protease
MKLWFLTTATITFAMIAAAPDIEAKKKGPAGPPTISQKDKQVGTEAHPQLVQEFGGAFEGPQAAYVQRVGKKIVNQTGVVNAENEFTITLLNSPVNNAFAVPGGYLYVTRQLMALMNNEAELASVLGHEAGHIIGQHSKKRNSQSTKTGLLSAGASILGAVLGGSQGAQIGQQIGQRVFGGMLMKYSRNQEFESDDFGVTYLNTAGYDPMAASTMLASLAAQSNLDMRRAGQTERSTPSWAMSHPDPASRVIRAQQKASALSARGRITNEAEFLSMLDGMLYDDDPKQGIIEGQQFLHPDLKLAFTAPPGFAMNNGSAAVTMSGSTGQAQFTGGNGANSLETTLAEAFKKIGGQTPLNYGTVQRTTINGLTAAYASADAQSQSGQKTVTVYVYDFGSSAQYYIVSIHNAGTSNPFTSLFQSVRRLSSSEVSSIKPRRIDVVTARSGDSVASLAAKMAYSDYREERFRVLNGLDNGATIKSGQRLKIIVQ